jgi:hypothetical protein
MDQRVFIKKCGRDQLGNTKTADLPGRPGREFLANEVEVAIFDPQGVHELREPKFNKKKAEIEYARSVEEVIEDHAKVIADGRPYFIGTVADMPEDGEFRGAWFYDDETDPANPRIGVDIKVAREVQKLRVRDLAGRKIRLLDPLDDKYQEKKDAIAKAVKSLDVSTISTTAELKKAVPPEVL